MLQYRKSQILDNDQNKNNNSSDNDNNSSQSIKEEYLSLVFLNFIRNQEDLLDLLVHNLPRLLKYHPTISVVILDGIATLFRGYKYENENLANPWHDRSSKFFQISSKCKELSFHYQVPFLVTNEATSRIASTTTSGHNIDSMKSNLEPALGLSWSQSINASFFVTRKSSLTESENSNKRRIIRCNKSPHVPSNTVEEFVIEPRGATRLT